VLANLSPVTPLSAVRPQRVPTCAFWLLRQAWCHSSWDRRRNYRVLLGIRTERRNHPCGRAERTREPDLYPTSRYGLPTQDAANGFRRISPPRAPVNSALPSVHGTKAWFRFDPLHAGRLAAPPGQRRTQRRIPACGCALVGGPGDVPVRAYQHHRERSVGGGRRVDSIGPFAYDGGACARGCKEHELATSQDLIQSCLPCFRGHHPDIGRPPSG
jgi:hypothetical protein